MEENKKKEELQSRRGFFKSAAKKALPILAAVALANVPQIMKASEEAPSDCRYGCAYSCLYGCSGSCNNSCSGSCNISCVGTCSGGCQGCYTGCQGSCKLGCKDNCSVGCYLYCG